MEIILVVVVLGTVTIALNLIYNLLRRINKHASRTELLTGLVYCVSIFLFGIGFYFHSNSYDVAVDPVDWQCYSPFSEEHIITLIYYMVLFTICSFLIWKRGSNLPPLLLAMAMSSILAGVILNVIILLQVTQHNVETLGQLNNDGSWLFCWFPIVSIIMGSLILLKAANSKSQTLILKKTTNPILNVINQILIRNHTLPFAIVILLLPLFVISTLILTVFGQEPDSVIKVFQDTTLWRFSQQVHPPVLDHKGHYLCTVAAKGNPALVKPISIGQRGGKPIIVNRQLQIANAFEELIQDFSPAVHKFIRRCYDRYGYNISRQINTSAKSDIIYVMMKPLEWFFLLILYTFCLKPENKIAKQYL